MSGVIITCNAGSTSTKLAAFDAVTLERKESAITHNSADTTEWLGSISTMNIKAIGYRVVHGGVQFTHPEVITDNILKKLASYIPLAPLHQPAAVKIITQVNKLYPDVPHIACFDTAFHHTIPDIQRKFAIPERFYNEGIMRYGFHGLSYEYIASVLPDHIDTKKCRRIIVAHMGGGSSACAMKDLKSVSTTMGFSTLDGLMMATRSGAIDPGVILHLLQQKNMNAEEISNLLYNESGLKGVSGFSNNMKELLESPEAKAKEAVELYCIMAAKSISGLLPSIGGLDTLVFTGGIGENAEYIRNNVAELLSWAGDFSVHVIPTNEELIIAKACANHSKNHL